MYQPFIGNHSKHKESNENGKKVIGFAAEHDLRVATTCFEHKDIHKEMWIAPDGKTVNQIDHILIESKHLKDADSDHLLVRAKKKYKKPQHRNRQKKVDRRCVQRLNNESTRKEYQKQISDKLEIYNSSNVERRWQKLEERLKEGANILKDEGHRSIKRWFDADCKNQIEIRSQARIKMLKQNTVEIRYYYKQCRKKVKKICRRKKREHVEEQIKNIENNYTKKQTRHKKTTKRLPSQDTLLQKQRGKTSERSGGEFEKVGRTLYIAAEIIKMGGEKFEENLYNIIADVWTQETMPRRW